MKIKILLTILLLGCVNILAVSAQNTGTITGNSGTSCPYITITENNDVKRIKISDLLGATGTVNLTGTVTPAPSGTISPNNPNNPSTEVVNDKNGNPMYVTKDGIILTVPAGGTIPAGAVKLTRSELLKIFSQSYYSKIACPPNIADLQTLFLRVIVILNTVVGIVVFGVFCKASFIRITAGGNPDALKKAIAMFKGAIIGLLIVLGAYAGLIFLGTRLLPTNPCYRYSFFDAGKILFFFDQSDISPVLEDEYKAKQNLRDGVTTIDPQYQDLCSSVR